MALSYILASSVPTTITVAKTRVFIGTTAADPTTDTYTEVGAVKEIPTFGPKETEIKIQTIGNDLEITEKGVTTLGGGDLTVAQDLTDAGQAAMAAAQAAKTGNYNMRLVFPDGVSGASVLTSASHGTYIDLKIKVLGTQTMTGGPNNEIRTTYNIAFNSKPTKTAAT